MFQLFLSHIKNTFYCTVNLKLKQVQLHACDCKHDGLILTQGNEIIIIFSLISPYDNEAKHGVKVRHHQNSVESGNQESVLMEKRSILTLASYLSSGYLTWCGYNVNWKKNRVILKKVQHACFFCFTLFSTFRHSC